MPEAHHKNRKSNNGTQGARHPASTELQAGRRHEPGEVAYVPINDFSTVV